MPTISTFYGIMIRMFYDDHVLAGRLPRRALAMALEWAASHQVELLEDWELCRQHKQPKQIQPLE